MLMYTRTHKLSFHEVSVSSVSYSSNYLFLFHLRYQTLFSHNTVVLITSQLPNHLEVTAKVSNNHLVYVVVVVASLNSQQAYVSGQ